MSEEKIEKETISPEEKAKNLKMLIIFGSCAALLLVIDFVTKWLVQSFAGTNPIEVIPNFFYITKSYNTAVAFSWGSSIPVVPRRIINIVISLVMSGLIIGYWVKNNDDLTNWDRACAMLLASGAVGNLIDRAFYWQAITGFDGVIDFFQFYLGGGPSAGTSWINPFATFNVADACLTVGVIMLIVLFAVDMIKHPTDDLEVDPRLVEEAKA
ncbi:MAG: signal peptidase II, partial [Bacilli bacterium]|nr:signal peptidase II [Bacilli bacterium]